jgi:hypothetical protein
MMETILLPIATLAIAALISNPTSAAGGTGTWYYGPDVSENYACQRAESLAKMDAIRSVLGENIFVDEFSQCAEVKGKVECRIESSAFSITDSYVRKVKVLSRELQTHKGRNSCTVEVDVQVTNDRPKIDAYVDARFFYKAGEQMKFHLKTNEPTYVYVFHTEGNKSTLIWPAFAGTNHYVANELTVPTSGYRFTARAGKNKFDESLVFVFTNDEMKFMRDYELNDLNNKLLSIPITNRRIIRRNLVIEQ